MNLLEDALGLHRGHAVLDELDAVEVVVYERKCVIIQLSLIHQVSHQSHHHLDLTLHVLHLLLRRLPALHVALY